MRFRCEIQTRRLTETDDRDTMQCWDRHTRLQTRTSAQSHVDTRGTPSPTAFTAAASPPPVPSETQPRCCAQRLRAQVSTAGIYRDRRSSRAVTYSQHGRRDSNVMNCHPQSPWESPHPGRSFYLQGVSCHLRTQLQWGELRASHKGKQGHRTFKG